MIDQGLGPIKIVIPKATLIKAPVPRVLDEIQVHFQEPIKPPFTFAKVNTFVANQSEHITLISITSSNCVQLHPILAHSKVPEDIFRCVVFQGVLLYWAAKTQSKKLSNPMEVPEIAKWVEDSMRLVPASEFYVIFLERFFKWALSLRP